MNNEMNYVLPEQEELETRKCRGRRIVRRDKAKAYREIKKLKDKLNKQSKNTARYKKRDKPLHATISVQKGTPS